MTPTRELELPEPEFSRPQDAEALPHGTIEKSFKANAAECMGLKERFSIDKLSHLSTTLQLARRGSGKHLKINVTGRFRAKITQTCVVTLQPFTTEIRSDFEALYDSQVSADSEDWEMNLRDDDPPEPIINGIIDLGELVAQNLGLEIDSHPRKPGAESDLVAKEIAKQVEETSDNDRENPFAALQKLKFGPESEK